MERPMFSFLKKLFSTPSEETVNIDGRLFDLSLKEAQRTISVFSRENNAKDTKGWLPTKPPTPVFLKPVIIQKQEQELVLNSDCGNPFFIKMAEPHLLSRARLSHDPAYPYYFHITRLRDFDSNPWYEQWTLKKGRIETMWRSGVVGMGYPNRDGTRRWDVFADFKKRIGKNKGLSARQLEFSHEKDNPADEDAISLYAPCVGQLGYFSARMSAYLSGFAYQKWELGLYYDCVEKAENGYDYILFKVILRSPTLDQLNEQQRVYIGSKEEEKLKKRSNYADVVK